MSAKKIPEVPGERGPVLVRDRMTVGLERIHLVVRLQDAAEKMREAGVGLLAVYDGAELLGVLTDRDLVVRVVAKGLDPSATSVSEALSPRVFHCHEDDTLRKALEQMRTHHVRRLVVFDRKNEPVGLISVDDAAPVEAARRAVAAVIASAKDS